ncbi:unnamed protein product [Cochlearia groenlandica]
MSTGDLVSIIFEKIKTLEPEDAQIIIRYFLAQDINQIDLITLAFGPINVLQSFCRKALIFLYLYPKPINTNPKSYSKPFREGPYFRKRSFSANDARVVSEKPWFRGTGYQFQRAGLAHEEQRMLQRQGSKSEEIGFRGTGYQSPQAGLAHQQQRMVQRQGLESEEFGFRGTGYQFQQAGLAHQQQRMVQRQGLDSEEPGFRGTGLVDSFGSSRGEIMRMKLAQQQQRIAHAQSLQQTRQGSESEERTGYQFPQAGLVNDFSPSSGEMLRMNLAQQQQRMAAALSFQQMQTARRGAGLVDDSGGEMMRMNSQQQGMAAAQSLQQTRFAQRQGSESEEQWFRGTGYQIPQAGLVDDVGKSGEEILRRAVLQSLQQTRDGQRQGSLSEQPWLRGSGYVEDSGDEIMRMNLAQQSLQQRQGSELEALWLRRTAYQFPQAGLGDNLVSSSGEMVADAAQRREKEFPRERQMQQIVERGTFSDSEEEMPRRRGDVQELIELEFERMRLSNLQAKKKKESSILAKHPQEVVAKRNKFYKRQEASTTGNTLGDSMLDTEENEADPSDQSSESS